MGHMDNGAHEAIVYRGMGYREYRPHSLWGTGGMWSHGHWHTWVTWGTGGMAHMGYKVQGV